MTNNSAKYPSVNCAIVVLVGGGTITLIGILFFLAKYFHLWQLISQM